MRKKVIAIVLAFVMVFGLSITSFASTTRTVTVKIENPAYVEAINNGQPTTGIPQYLINNQNVTVTLSGTASLYDSMISNPSDIENHGIPTAMDAIIQALNESNLSDTSINCTRVQYVVWDATENDYVPVAGRYGVAFDTLAGIQQQSTTSGDHTTYKFWQTNYNGNVTSDYATAYPLSNGDIVEVKWAIYEWYFN